VPAKPVQPPAVVLPPIRSGAVDIVAIGSSTGGPNALAELFFHLPADFPVPIVIAQHMPPLFTQLLAERLTRESPIPVEEASEGAVLQPGRAWIAPGDHHLVLARKRGAVQLSLNQDPPENSCRPSVDVLFRSVECVYKNRVLVVVLTGMGEDGLKGGQVLHATGASIIAQDQESSVVWGMPGAVARAGITDKVLPLGEIAGEITRRV
jgi:two-component system chemotaxis response regulator CheB